MTPICPLRSSVQRCCAASAAVGVRKAAARAVSTSPSAAKAAEHATAAAAEPQQLGSTTFSKPEPLSVDLADLPHAPFFVLKRKLLATAHYWNNFARQKPLIDVRTGVPVHVYASNTLTSTEDSKNVRRLIDAIKPSTILVQHVPDFWEESDNRVRRARDKYISELTSVARTADSPFVQLRQLAAADAGVSKEAVSASFDEVEACEVAENEELERIDRFRAALLELQNQSRIINPDFVNSCMYYGNIPKWECYAAYDAARQQNIKFVAVDLPLEQHNEHQMAMMKAWNSLSKNKPTSEKLVPLLHRLSDLVGLGAGDLLQPQGEAPGVWKKLLRMLPGGKSGPFKSFMRKDELTYVPDPTSLHGCLDLKTARAANACLADEAPEIRAVQADREEYIAYSIWKSLGAFAGKDNSKESASASSAWKTVAHYTVNQTPKYSTPEIPRNVNHRFVPPSPHAPRSNNRVLLLIDREQMPGVIRYWKMLNASIPMENRYDRDQHKPRSRE